jgi:hypothetical protein
VAAALRTHLRGSLVSAAGILPIAAVDHRAASRSVLPEHFAFCILHFLFFITSGTAGGAEQVLQNRKCKMQKAK